MTTPAATLSVSIDGVFLNGLGSCLAAPSGCTNPAIPPGSDSNGPFDQVTLIAYSTSVDSAAGSVSLGQGWIFVPGDTGAGSTGFLDGFSLNRNVTVSYAGNSITHLLIQAGDILVGDEEDTMTIHASTPLAFDLTSLGLSGTLTLTLGETSVTAGIDPEGTVPGQIDITTIPEPVTPALLAIGLLGFAFSLRMQKT